MERGKRWKEGQTEVRKDPVGPMREPDTSTPQVASEGPDKGATPSALILGERSVQCRCLFGRTVESIGRVEEERSSVTDSGAADVICSVSNIHLALPPSSLNTDFVHNCLPSPSSMSFLQEKQTPPPAPGMVLLSRQLTHPWPMISMRMVM